MYRTASSRLRALKASFRSCDEMGRSGSLARFASSSALASNAPSSGGLFGWLTGGKSSSLPPLDFPLEGITLPPSLPDYVQPSKTKITTLPNGLKIASEASA
ncbi:Mitochondrial-processing peptidase subunit alpha-like protein, partial [Drosera capensis]